MDDAATNGALPCWVLSHLVRLHQLAVRSASGTVHLVLRFDQCCYDNNRTANNNSRNDNDPRNNDDMGILHNIHNQYDNLYYYCTRNDCPCSDIYLFDHFHHIDHFNDVHIHDNHDHTGTTSSPTYDH